MGEGWEQCDHRSMALEISISAPHGLHQTAANRHPAICPGPCWSQAEQGSIPLPGWAAVAMLSHSALGSLVLAVMG